MCFKPCTLQPPGLCGTTYGTTVGTVTVGIQACGHCGAEEHCSSALTTACVRRGTHGSFRPFKVVKAALFHWDVPEFFGSPYSLNVWNSYGKPSAYRTTSGIFGASQNQPGSEQLSYGPALWTEPWPYQKGADKYLVQTQFLSQGKNTAQEPPEPWQDCAHDFLHPSPPSF